MTIEPVTKLIDDACKRYAERTAMFERGGNPILFKNLFFISESFAGTLAERGVREGDFVAMDIGDAVSTISLILSLLKIGAKIVPMSRYHEKDTKNAQFHWVLITEDRIKGDPREIVFRADWLRPPKRPFPGRGKGIYVSSSSGTTGEPKQYVSSETLLASRVLSEIERRDAPTGPIFNGFRPTTSVGLKCILVAMYCGLPQLHKAESEEKTLRLMAELGVTDAYLPPISFKLLVDAAKTAPVIPKSMEKFRVGGGAISSELAKEAEELFDCEVFSTFGSAETGSISMYRILDYAEYPGVVGPIGKNLNYRFTGEFGEDVDEETGGDLWIQVPRDERRPGFAPTPDPYDEDGWVDTGDIGRILPNGSLQLIGRKAEFINIGGNKFAPSVFENKLRKLPYIGDVAAFRVAGTTGIDEVGLAVVPREDFDVDVLHAYLKNNFDFYIKFHIKRMDEIPYTEMGKVNRRSLTQSAISQ